MHLKLIQEASKSVWACVRTSVKGRNLLTLLQLSPSYFLQSILFPSLGHAYTHPLSHSSASTCTHTQTPTDTLAPSHTLGYKMLGKRAPFSFHNPAFHCMMQEQVHKCHGLALFHLPFTRTLVLTHALTHVRAHTHARAHTHTHARTNTRTQAHWTFNKKGPTLFWLHLAKKFKTTFAGLKSDKSDLEMVNCRNEK